MQQNECSLIVPWVYKCPILYKKEKDFTTRYNKELWKDAFVYKISDESRGYKPFDCFWMYWWIWFAIELKITKSITCKPFLLLRWSSASKPWTQVANLTKWQEKWWLSLVVVYNTINKNFRIINFKDLTPNTIVSLWNDAI